MIDCNISIIDKEERTKIDNSQKKSVFDQTRNYL